MEPADLNSSTNANDDGTRLEAMLRGAAPALPDDGFSARVLAALPAAEEQRTPWRRIAFCLGGAAAGCGVAFWRSGAGPGLQSSLEHFGVTMANACLVFTNPIVSAALVATALSLLVAFRTELREKLLS